MRSSSESGFNLLLRLIHILVLRKWFIIGVTGLGTLIAVVTVLLLPSRYRAAAMIKPPSSEGGGQMQFQSMLEDAGPLSGMLGSLLGSSTGENDCMNILGSTQFARLVIEKFDLETEYKFRKKKKYYFADVLKKFREKMTFHVTDEEAIIITMEDRSAEKASEMVDFMIHALDSIYTDIQRKATNQRLAYIEQRVGLAEGEMTGLEDSLVRFQNKNNLYLPEVQIESTLENVVKIEAQLELLDQEMKLESALRGRATPRYSTLLTQKRVLERQLDSKFGGRRTDSSSLVFPVHSLPALANEYFRLERAYKIKLTLYKFLIQQLEFLRLEAQKDIKVISVLDPPWPNEKRVFPKRRLVVQMVFALLLVLSCLGAVLLHLWGRHRQVDSEAYRLASEIRTNLFKVR